MQVLGRRYQICQLHFIGCMCKKKHNIYMVQHYPRFQAFPGGLGTFPCWKGRNTIFSSSTPLNCRQNHHHQKQHWWYRLLLETFITRTKVSWSQWNFNWYFSYIGKHHHLGIIFHTSFSLKHRSDPSENRVGFPFKTVLMSVQVSSTPHPTPSSITSLGKVQKLPNGPAHLHFL